MTQTFTREQDFETALIEALTQHGWEKEVLKQPSEKELIQNWANILYQNNNTQDRLNGVPLTEGEMQQLLEHIRELRTPVRLNGFINAGYASITRDSPDDPIHQGQTIALKLFGRNEIAAGQSRYQIARQPRFARGSALGQDRRGDVLLLINGIPLIHIELKRDGIPVGEAERQIEKYAREGVFSGIYRLIQIFVAMTPGETRYFANPGEGKGFNRLFHFEWGDVNNQPIKSWHKVATRLLAIPIAHQLIGSYTIADESDGVLKVLRSYQFEAVRAIVDSVYKRRDWGKEGAQRGGYIWHTTGSGKTMTSFKAAQLITDLGKDYKVVFVIDRIELGTQSARAYRSFAGADDYVQETEDTQTLLTKLCSRAVQDMLIVTSIQKLGILSEDKQALEMLTLLKEQRLVFIVDECHRSTFGDTFVSIRQAFPRAMFFGFTGTPIQSAEQRGGISTADIFGDELHRYSIADGIRDKNVLGFDTYMVRTYKDKDLRRVVALEQCRVETEEEALANDELRDVYNYWMLVAPMASTLDEAGQRVEGVEDILPRSQYEREEHCREVVKDIREGWAHLSQGGRFHSMLTVSSIPQAMRYFRLFAEEAPELRVTALFDPSLPNDNPDGVLSKEEGLLEILAAYNARYGTHFDIARHAAFKQDLSCRLSHKYPYVNPSREQCIDILIVVSQMLTGFDSKWINTLYIDRTLEYADLIQAFSRTNRVYGPDKPFGTIRYYYKPHTMRENIKRAIKLYSGDAELGVFVDKLGANLSGMNQLYREIEQLFTSAGIVHYTELPAELVLRARFAKLFRSYHRYFEAAKVQGFSWAKSVYETEDAGKVTLNHDEHTYNVLLQRYKELTTASGGDGSGTTPEDLPYEIDTYITELNTERIDNDYMQHNFERYLRALDQPGVSAEELACLLQELSASFASLPQEEQRFAEVLLDDIRRGDLQVEAGKSFREYILSYMEHDSDKRINELVEAFGLDKALLLEILKHHPTEASINDFGRFDRLQQNRDKAKSKAYLEQFLGRSLTLPEANREFRKMLYDFILSR